jgi:signal transduction histidine kinase
MTENMVTLNLMLSPRAFVLRLAAGLLAVNLFVVALAALSLYHSRQLYKERLAVQTQNLSQALELTVEGIIDKSDVALQGVVDEAEKEIAGGGPEEQAINAFIARQYSRVPELNGLRVTNTQGEVAYGTDVVSGSLANVADRDFFIDARDNRRGNLFVSRPIVSRIDKTRVFIISRRVNNPDGSFAGVAYVSLPVDYFLTLFSTFAFGSNGSITLRAGDLAVIARYPRPAGLGSTPGNKWLASEFGDLFRKDQTAGTYTARSVIDSVERMVSYRKISVYPLYIVVGMATNDYLAVWRGEAAKMLVLVSFFVIGTLVSAWQVFRNWKGKREALEELRRQHEQLEDQVRERTTELEAFNYTVSHDLRRPLTNINTYCQVIMELWGDKLDEQCKVYIQEANQETLNMNQMIKDILNFSRMTHQELHREPVDLSSLVHQAAIGFQMAEPERQVTFRIAEGVKVSGDPNLLRLALDNILSNAWKYTAGKDAATVEFGVRESGGETSYFVRDNGAGFDMKYAAQLFVPFQRLPGTGTCKGYGIGLATAERIIRRHGGRIWAEGEPGLGATFYFTL